MVPEEVQCQDVWCHVEALHKCVEKHFSTAAKTMEAESLSVTPGPVMVSVWKEQFAPEPLYPLCKMGSMYMWHSAFRSIAIPVVASSGCLSSSGTGMSLTWVSWSRIFYEIIIPHCAVSKTYAHTRCVSLCNHISSSWTASSSSLTHQELIDFLECIWLSHTPWYCLVHSYFLVCNTFHCLWHELLHISNLHSLV